MAAISVADELRDFAMRWATDEDIDYIVDAHEHGDVEVLRKFVVSLAREHGVTVPDRLAA